jgi:hypothetical protein
MPDVPQINLGSDHRLRDWVQLTRDFMRDYGELNRLMAGEETSDRMIAFGLMFTVDKFNILPPLIGAFSISDMPHYLLLKGTASHIMQSAGILQTRNQLDYSAGGVSVAHSNKTPLYQSWSQMWDSEWHQMAKQFKVAMNIERAYGHSVSSEYLFLNGFFRGLLKGEYVYKLCSLGRLLWYYVLERASQSKSFSERYIYA